MSEPLRDYAVLSRDPHADCTCCRHGRLAEQSTEMDEPFSVRATGSWVGSRPTPLLPPIPQADLHASVFVLDGVLVCDGSGGCADLFKLQCPGIPHQERVA